MIGRSKKRQERKEGEGEKRGGREKRKSKGYRRIRKGKYGDKKKRWKTKQEK